MTEKGALRDVAVLVLLVVAAAALSLRGLGFYGDDWAHLAALANADGGSFLERYAALADPNNAQRPVQLAWLALLHGVFGEAPLGYHVVNVAVLAACAVLFYRAIRGATGDRGFALAAAALFALVPHFATAHFWIAAAQVPLSVALALASFLAGQRAARAPRGSARAAWTLASLAALVGAGLAYETVIPLLLLSGVLLAWGAPRERLAAAVAPAALGLAAVVVFKVAVSTRIGEPVWPDHLAWFSVFVSKAFFVALVKYGAALPLVAWRILVKRPDPAAIALALAAAALVYDSVARAVRETGLPARTLAWRRVGIGALATLAGWAIFLTNANAGITTSGIDNRLAMAATLGVAMTLAAAAEVVASFVRSPRAAGAVFAGLVAAGSGAGLLALQDIGGFWARAYDTERAVVADIRRAHPVLPRGGTLLLDGVCPYDGPAIVFESYWDLAGALRLAYGDPSLRADVVTPNLTVRPEGIRTVLYDTLVTDYPFGPDVLVHHFGRDERWILDSEGAARGYFAAMNPDRNSDCPPGRAGAGAGIY